MPGALVPSTGFTDAEPVEPKASSGAFFWVLHTFKPDGAGGFWGKIGPALGDPAKFAAMVEGHKSALCGNQPVRHAIEQTSRRWREGAVKF